MTSAPFALCCRSKSTRGGLSTNVRDSGRCWSTRESVLPLRCLLQMHEGVLCIVFFSLRDANVLNFACANTVKRAEASSLRGPRFICHDVFGFRDPWILDQISDSLLTTPFLLFASRGSSSGFRSLVALSGLATGLLLTSSAASFPRHLMFVCHLEGNTGAGLDFDAPLLISTR